MRYDPATRIMTLSFVRDPGEHADVMLEAGKRLVTTSAAGAAWRPFLFTIGFGAVVGITMEIYRRFVLPQILSASEIVPFGVVVLQFLPIILLAAAAYIFLLIRIATTRRKTLISKLDPKLFIDADIYEKGISTTGGRFTVEIDWAAVDKVSHDERRIDVECEGYVIYFPERAFENRAAFNKAAATMRRLWREAKKTERDSKMVAAGLD